MSEKLTPNIRIFMDSVTKKPISFEVYKEVMGVQYYRGGKEMFRYIIYKDGKDFFLLRISEKNEFFGLAPVDPYSSYASAVEELNKMPIEINPELRNQD